MKAMIYVIRFESELELRDIEWFLKEIKSPIRLEIGDKIALSFASFDRSLEDNRIDGMVERLLEKSIYPSKHRAFFEISDIIYNHGCYDYYGETNFHGIIILKGK